MSYTPNQLDELLIPTFLRNLSPSEQISTALANTSQAMTFRKQVQAFRYRVEQIFNAKPKINNPNTYTIPWDTPEGPLIISVYSLFNYYTRLFSTPTSGFPIISSKIMNCLINTAKSKRNCKKCARPNGCCQN